MDKSLNFSLTRHASRVVTEHRCRNKGRREIFRSRCDVICDINGCDVRSVMVLDLSLTVSSSSFITFGVVSVFSVNFVGDFTVGVVSFLSVGNTVVAVSDVNVVVAVAVFVVKVDAVVVVGDLFGAECFLGESVKCWYISFGV